MVVLSRPRKPGHPELWQPTLLNLYFLLMENTAPSTSYSGFLIPSHFRPSPSYAPLPCISVVSGVSGSVFVHDSLQSDLMIPSSLLPVLPSLSISPLLAPPQRPITKFSKSLLKTKILSLPFPSRFGFLSHVLPQRVYFCPGTIPFSTVHYLF